MKLYFYQSDIDEFNQKKNDLDDMVGAGDISFAYTVFNRLLKRIDERVALVDELLEGGLRFHCRRSARHRSRQAVVSQDARRGQGPLVQAAEVRRARCSRPTRRPSKGRGRPAQQRRPQGAAQAALPQLRQADAPDRQQRAARDVPHGDHQRLRSAQHLHGAGRRAENFNIIMGLQLRGHRRPAQGRSTATP